MIKIFDASATSFDTLGLGILNDAIKCIVTEERNGKFELEMDYPIDGIHYDDIALRSIIVCKSNPFSREQAFRVYYMSKPINGIVTINAEHISYDLSGMVASPFIASNIGEAFNGLKNNSVPECPFEFHTDKDVVSFFEVKTPSTIRSMLGGTEGSILDVYGTGEYEFSNYSVTLHLHRGQNRGVTLRYGKNITDLTQEENCSKVYTAVYPYWSGVKYENNVSSDVVITLPEKTVPVDGTFGFTRVMSLDMSSYFNDAPSINDLRNRTKEYISQNGIGKPEVSIKVSFVQLEQAEEYEQLKLLESVYLCDEVTVIFEKLGVNSTAKCITTEYNAITDKYESLEFGDSRTNLANTIINQSAEIKNIPSTSFMEKEIEKATMLITGGLGGYVMLHSSSGQKQPDELLILGEESEGDLLKAQNVWRFNMAGLGFSSNGYEGPYKAIALTVDGDNKGTILADKVAAEGIQAGTIDAELTITASSFGDGSPSKLSRINLFSSAGTGLLFGTEIGYSHGCNILCTEGDLSEFTKDEGFGVMAKENHGTSTNPVRSGLWQHHHSMDYYWYDSYYGTGHWGRYRTINFRYGTIESHPNAVNENGQWRITTFSDARLKENIEDIPIEVIRELFARIAYKTFNFKNDIRENKKTHYGLIAQEIKEIFEDLNIETDEFIGKSSFDDEYYYLAYENITRFCIPAVKDLYEIVNRQQKQIDYLQNEIKVLREEIK